MKYEFYVCDLSLAFQLSSHMSKERSIKFDTLTILDSYSQLLNTIIVNIKRAYVSMPIIKYFVSMISGCVN